MDYIVKKANAESIHALLRNKYKGEELARKKSLYNKWIKRGIGHSSKRILLNFCKDFDIPYFELEKRGIVLDFPNDLGKSALWKIATHILNEGNIDRSYYKVSYYNKDPVLHWYLKKNLEDIGRRLLRITFRRNLLESYADAKTGRLLNFIGVPTGNKTVNQPTIDLSKMNDDAWRYHIQTTITEEGSATLELVKKVNKLVM